MAKYKVELRGGENGVFDRLSERAIAELTAELKPVFHATVRDANRLSILRGYRLPEPMLFIGHNGGDNDWSFRSARLKTEIARNFGENISVEMTLESDRHLIGKRVMLMGVIEARMTVRAPNGWEMVIDYKLTYMNGRREDVKLWAGIYGSSGNNLQNVSYNWEFGDGGQPSKVIMGLGIDVAQGVFLYGVSRQGFETFFEYLRRMGLR